MKVFLCSIALCLIATSFGKKPGDACTKSDTCEDNSKCEKKHKFCEDMICKCKDNYYMPSGTTKCLLKHGQPCETASKADAKCVTNYCDANKKCGCETNKSWSKGTSACVAGKVKGEACDAQKPCFTTNANLKCDTTCKCKDGYESENDYDLLCTKKTVKGFDETCANDAECNSNYNLKCMTKCKCDTDNGFKKMAIQYTDDMGASKEVHKCLHVNATVNVAAGEECKTTMGVWDDTMKYCAKGLYCGRCGSATKDTCLKNLDPTSGAGQVTFGLLVAVGCFALRKFIM